MNSFPSGLAPIRPTWIPALAALLSGCASLAPQGGALPQTPLPAAWSGSASTPGPATPLAQW